MRSAPPVVLVAALLLGAAACTADTGQAVRDPVVSPSPQVAEVRLLPRAQMVRNLDYYFGGRDPVDPTVMSVLVSAHGRLLVERYFAKDGAQAHNIASVTKSVVSTLVGIAADEGLLSLDDTLGNLLPSYSSSMTAEERGVRLGQLLSMTAGLAADPDGGGVSFDATASDWVRDILRQGQTEPIGHFAYSSGTSHLLGAILTEATGRSVLEYAEERLFGPLGIDTSSMTQPAFDASTVRAFAKDPRSFRAYDRARLAWPVDPQGRNLGFGLLKLRPRDLLRFGQLYLGRGRWQGRQVVSADWVERATRDELEFRESDQSLGYGFQWWVGDLAGAPAAVAMGIGGQLVIVVPTLDLVAVATSVITEPLTLDPVDLLETLGECVVAPS